MHQHVLFAAPLQRLPTQLRRHSGSFSADTIVARKVIAASGTNFIA